ncbi:MAG: MFS transporter [Deferribacterales bacterium]
MNEKKATLTIAVLSSFLTPFMLSSLNISLPTIAKDFNINAIMMGWIATSYLLATSIFLVPMGKLADIKGKKKIFLYGIAIFTLSSFLCGIAHSAILMIIFRIVQGLGSALIFSTSIAIITSVFPQSERGKVLGITVSSVYSGLSLGPFLGGIITEYLSWRIIFVMMVPVGLIIMYIVKKYLSSEWVDAENEKIDIIGSTLYIISISLLMIGLINFTNLYGILIFLVGVVFITIFIFYELKIDYPIVNIKLFKQNKVFTYSNLAALANYSSTFAVTFLLSIYLQNIKDFTPKSTGVLLIILPVMMAIFSPIAGRLSDRIEPRILSSSGMLIIAVSFIPLSFLDKDSNMLMILIPLFVQGIGFALFSSPNANAIMSSVEKRYYGVASAIMATMRMVGQSTSLAISMLLFSLFFGNEKLSKVDKLLFIDAIRYGFIIFSVISFLGMFASLKRGNIR